MKKHTKNKGSIEDLFDDNSINSDAKVVIQLLEALENDFNLAQRNVQHAALTLNDLCSKVQRVISDLKSSPSFKRGYD